MVRIIVGDALEALRGLPDGSVHCCVTSPPYWGLRSYQGDAGMIGLEPTFEAHLANLVSMFREVRRVLRDDGTCWLNYGDAYAGAPSGGSSPDGDRKGRADTARRKTGKSGRSWKPKDLMMMPARVAMALQADGTPDKAALDVLDRVWDRLAASYGSRDLPRWVVEALNDLENEYLAKASDGGSWWIRSELIWQKPNPMPESVRDRPTSSHEKVYLMTKSGSALYWTNPNYHGVRTQPEPDYVYDVKTRKRRNLWVGHSYFYDADAVRTPSDDWHGGCFNPLAPEVQTKRKEAVTRIPPEKQAGANLRNVMKVATHAFREAHFATFPPKLIEPFIKAGTSAHGCCADCGAGWVRVVETTLLTKGRGVTYTDRAREIDTEDYGWRPSCECEADTVPATVLDPFAGAGTTGLVADRLGRDAILIEISPEYAEMAAKRIRGDNPMFTSVEVT